MKHRGLEKMTDTTPQPQPQPTPLVSTVSLRDEEDEGRITMNSTPSRQYVSPMPRANNSLVLHQTPMEEAVKLEGPEFEQIMKERTRMRREKEHSHVAELRVKVSRLEQALAAETKRRVEVTRALEKKAKAEVKYWEERCLKEMQEHQKLVDERLENLEYRLDQLENSWVKDCQQQKEQITRKGGEFSTALAELRKEAETERKLREVRESQFLKQIESHRKDYEERWNRERQERIDCVGELVNQLESNEEARMEQRKAVEIRLEQELAQLQHELEQETIERKSRDNEISTALERYTIQFQASLSTLISDD